MVGSYKRIFKIGLMNGEKRRLHKLLKRMQEQLIKETKKLVDNNQSKELEEIEKDKEILRKLSFTLLKN